MLQRIGPVRQFKIIRAFISGLIVLSTAYAAFKLPDATYYPDKYQLMSAISLVVIVGFAAGLVAIRRVHNHKSSIQVLSGIYISSVYICYIVGLYFHAFLPKLWFGLFVCFALLCIYCLWSIAPKKRPLSSKKSKSLKS